MSTLTDSGHAPGLAWHRPFHWLECGWEDFRRHETTSCAYGLIVAAGGGLLLALGNHPYFAAICLSGFLLVGPLLTTGLCELSRLDARGETADFDASLAPLSRHRQALLDVARTLLTMGVVWFLVSILTLQLSFHQAAPGLGESLWQSALPQIGGAELLAYVVLGGGLAGLVFALSVVTIPLIIDRDQSARAAMRQSLAVTRRHPDLMLIWAGLIVALILIGYFTALLGLIVIFPLLGHATWHAYEDLVPR